MLPQKNDRILVIHTAFLGDIVLATPFLAALRQAEPDAEIFFLTTPGGAALLEANPWGVQSIVYDKKGKESGLLGFLKKRRELRELSPRKTFCLHRSFRSVLLAEASGGESWGFHDATGSFLLHHKVHRTSGLFEAEKNLLLLEGKHSPYPKLSWKQADEESVRGVLPIEPFIAIAPSSVWPTKRWPAEKFAQLMQKFPQEQVFILVGSREDSEVAAELASRVPAHKVYNLCGKTSLGALKYVLSRASLVVSNDSSPLHIAIAVGAPVHGVFGPTTKELGFFPLAPNHTGSVSELKGLECRPCGKHGHVKCPQGHFRCMLDLSAEQVYREIRECHH